MLTPADSDDVPVISNQTRVRRREQVKAHKAFHMGNFAASLLFGASVLFSLNIQGADPSDYIFVLLGVLLASNGGTRFIPVASPAIRVAVGCFVISYILSMILTDFKHNYAATLAVNLIIVYSIVVYASNYARMKRLLRGLLVGHILTCLAGLLLLLAPQIQPSFLFEIQRDGRFMGLMGDPNILALLTTFFVIWLWDECLNPCIFADNPWLARAGLLLNIIVLLLSQSRSSWLGCGIGLVGYFLILLTQRKVRALLKSCLVLFVGFIIISGILVATGRLEDVVTRASTLDEKDVGGEEDRLNFLYTLASIGQGMANPFGVGPGMAASATGLESVDGLPIGSHNLYVQVFTENGWLAAFGLATLIYKVFSNAFRNGRLRLRTHGISNSVILAAFVSLLLVGLFQDLIQWRAAWLVPSLVYLSFHNARISGKSRRFILRPNS
jgi:O-Antigen ligase